MLIKGDLFFSYSSLTNDSCHMLSLVLLSILLSYLPFIFLISHCHFLLSFPVPNSHEYFLFPILISFSPFLFPILISISYSPLPLPIPVLLSSSPFPLSFSFHLSYFPFLFPYFLFSFPISHSHCHFLLFFSLFLLPFSTFARAFNLTLKIDLAHSSCVDHTYSYK